MQFPLSNPNALGLKFQTTSSTKNHGISFPWYRIRPQKCPRYVGQPTAQRPRVFPNTIPNSKDKTRESASKRSLTSSQQALPQKYNPIVMSLPQHMTPDLVLNESEMSFDLSSVVLYLPHPDGAVFDSRRVGKARSSWALYSRLQRLKKRHCPSASKSLPHPSRKRCKKSEHISGLKIPVELGRSRWESLPSTTTSPNTNNSNPSSRSARRAATGRPMLPKRQVSMEHAKETDKPSRNAKVNQAAAGEQVLRSFRRSMRGETSAKQGVASAIQHHGARCA